jgi:hypothetical protein
MKFMNEEKRTTNTRNVVAVAVVLVFAVLVLWWRTPNKRIPDCLLGEWHTSEAGHSDRYFEINPVSISFTTGEGTVYTGFIKEIKQVQEGPSTLYTVVYDVDGTLNELSFYYESGTAKGTFIRFRNQQNIIWTKSESS